MEHGDTELLKILGRSFFDTGERNLWLESKTERANLSVYLVFATVYLATGKSIGEKSRHQESFLAWYYST